MKTDPTTKSEEAAPTHDGEGLVQPPLVRRLVEAREALRWTQVDVAAATGLQPSAVCHFEIGHRSPSISNLVKLAKALQVSTDWLLGLSDDRRETVVVIDGIRYFPSPNSKGRATTGAEENV